MIKKLFNQHKETIANSIWRGIQIGSKQGVIFVIFLISAKFLNPMDFGIFNYLTAVLSLLMLFCDFGISAATSKYIVEYKTKKSDKLKKILLTSIIIVVILATLISVIVMFFGKVLFKENFKYIIYFLPYLYLVPISSVIDGVYTGFKEFKKIAIISLIAGGISLLISYFLISKFTFLGAILSQNILYLLLVVGLLAFRKDLVFTLDFEIVKKITKYSLIIGFGSLSYFLYNRIGTIILQQFSYTVEIGYYEIINRFFYVSFLPFLIIGQVIYPNITRLYTENKITIIRKKYVNHLIFFSIIGIVISIILYFSYPFLLKTYLPKYFNEQSITMFKLMLLTYPFYVVASIVSQSYIISTENAKYNLLMFPFGVLNILLNFIFISNLGYMGVVYSTIICTCTYRITIFIILFNKFKTNAQTKIYNSG